VIYCDL